MADLYADGHHGVYIPKYFAESVKRECVNGVSDEDWNILAAGPDWEANPNYWEAWDDVLSNAVIKSPDGKTGFLYQDGDLWIIWGEDDPDRESIISEF